MVGTNPKLNLGLDHKPNLMSRLDPSLGLGLDPTP